MAPPTNPKKRALMPSTKLRKALRAAGHHLKTIVQVGKEGVTEPVLLQLDEALRAHELVKVKVGTESPEDRFEVADRLTTDSGAQVAQVLGRTVLVYRKHPEKPRFEAGPPAPPAGSKPASGARRPRARPARRAAPRKAATRPAEKTRRPAPRSRSSGGPPPRR